MWGGLRPARSAKPRSPPIEIELVAPEPAPRASAPPGRPARPNARPRGRTQDSLSRFVPNVVGSTSPVDRTATNDADPIEEEGEGDSRLSLGAFDGLGAADVAFAHALWRGIEARLPHLDLLSEYDHAGAVSLTLAVDARGALAPAGLRAKAEDRVLKVLAARAVRAAFREAEFPRPGAPLRLRARFVFGDPARCASVGRLRGRTLGFCRRIVNERLKFSRGERLDAYARAIARAGPWAGENIAKYERKARRRASEFDPFEELKRDPDWNL